MRVSHVTYHSVPSTSKTMPFNRGAFELAAAPSFNGANRRGVTVAILEMNLFIGNSCNTDGLRAS